MIMNVPYLRPSISDGCQGSDFVVTISVINVRISNTEFYLKQLRSVDIGGRNLFRPVSKVWHVRYTLHETRDYLTASVSHAEL